MADPDQFEETEGQAPTGKGLRTQLEAALQRAKEAEGKVNEMAGLQQKLAIHEAGLTLNPKQAKALLAAHEGELDPDGLKQTATDLGFLQPTEQPQTVPSDNPQPAPQPAQTARGVYEEELAAISRISDATVPSIPTNPDQVSELLKKMSEAEAQGQDAYVAFLRQNNLAS